ncbi:MAG: hypothetical protein ACOC93_06680, partial [Planctomycetota bacterium]
MIHRTNRILLAVALVAGLSGPAAAQQRSRGGATEEVVQMQHIRENFRSLMGEMEKVAGMIEESEPESARILREAVALARQALIAEDMDKAAELLAKGWESASVKAGEDVAEQLQKLHKKLLEGDIDVNERIERIRQWQKQLERIQELRARQQALEQTSRRASQGDETQRRLAQL